MSEGKLSVPSIDRKEAPEEKFDLLFEKIKKHDGYEKEINNISSTLNSMQEQIVNNLRNHVELSNRFVNTDVQRSTFEKSADQTLSDLKKKASGLSDSIAYLTQMHETLALRMHKALEAIEAKFLPKQEGIAKMNALETSYIKTRGDIASHASELSTVKEKIVPFASMAEKIDSGDQNLASQIKDIENRFIGRLSDLGQKIEEASQGFKKKIIESIQEPKDKLAELESQIQEHSSVFSSHKSETLTKINSISLDTSNALARSINADSQIKILDKKLENLTLQLKKYEIK